MSVESVQPDALELFVSDGHIPKVLEESDFIFFARDRLHHAAAGCVTPHRFIEKVLDMTKIIAPPYVMSMADRITYGVVGGVFVLAVFAFIFLQ